MAETIRFERVERDCQYNEKIKADYAGQSRRPHLLCDFKVMVQDEHRATFRKLGSRSGYQLYDADGRPIRWLAYTPNRAGHEVRAQSDFLSTIQVAMQKGLLPTVPEMARKRAEEAERDATMRADAEKEVREERIKRHGVDLLIALKAAVHALASYPSHLQADPDAKRALVDGRNVIAMAEDPGPFFADAVEQAYLNKVR